MILLSGKEVSKFVREELIREVNAFHSKFNRKPGLGVILVGDDPASQIYVGGKIKACNQVGLYSKEVKLSSTVSKSQLEAKIFDLIEDQQIDGILVQLPLPRKFVEREVLSLIPVEKDVDGLTTMSVGRLWVGDPLSTPCTPSGVMKILSHYNIEVAGKHAVVVGRSHIVGKPMAQLLLSSNATVTLCHSKTTNLSHHTKQADILVVAAGQPKLIDKKYVKEGAVVIDVGIHRATDAAGGKPKLCGDVNFDDIKNVVSAMTPVPGGVGPMTITMLLSNTIKLAYHRESQVYTHLV